jgi:23S rRNA pseudouridine955/2504/2580 synthase
MGGVKTVEVTPDEAGLRLDRWFKQHYPGLGHGRLEKLLRTGQVRVDGGRAKAGLRLSGGEQVRVPPLAADTAEKRKAVAAKVGRQDARQLVDRVLHRDEAVIVIDKPSGLAVQGGTGTTRHLDAMLDALRFGHAERPRLVHRLDKDTSGVLVLGRSAKATASLAAAFKGKEAAKLYWAVVVGVPRPASGRIDLALMKRPGRGGERVVATSEGKRAITHYRVVDKAARRAAWLALEPLTGRTHQLRAHCAALGTPILGDGKYGGADAFIQGLGVSRKLHLHARALRLPHPDGGLLEVSAPLPPHMAATWRLLGFDPADPAAGFASDLEE